MDIRTVPQNPNALPEPPFRKKRTARLVTAIVLSIFCVLSTTLALLCHYTQYLVSPELFHHCSEEMDPTGIVVALEENGTPFTLGEAIVACFDSLDIAVTHEEAREMLDRCAVPSLLTSTAQDVRRNFASGTVSLMTEDEIADFMLDAMDDGMFQFLSYLGDPHELTVYLFARAVSLIPIEEIADSFAPVRPLFSERLLVVSTSLAIISFCLLFLTGEWHTTLRFVFLADCVSFLGFTVLCAKLPYRLRSMDSMPFLNAVCKNVLYQFRVNFLIVATYCLILFVISLALYLCRRALLRSKAQDSQE